MVMPRSRSCGSKSVTVVPSWTSPRLWVAPVSVEDPLGDGGLARVDVGEDAELRTVVSGSGAHGPKPSGGPEKGSAISRRRTRRTAPVGDVGCQMRDGLPVADRAAHRTAEDRITSCRDGGTTGAVRMPRPCSPHSISVSR